VLTKSGLSFWDVGDEIFPAEAIIILLPFTNYHLYSMLWPMTAGVVSYRRLGSWAFRHHGGYLNFSRTTRLKDDDVLLHAALSTDLSPIGHMEDTRALARVLQNSNMLLRVPKLASVQSMRSTLSLQY
jgi:hypothetical protein